MRVAIFVVRYELLKHGTAAGRCCNNMTWIKDGTVA